MVIFIDGSKTPELYVKGGPAKNSLVHVVANHEYTVVKEDETGNFVYAALENITEKLVRSGYRVGD